jgi:hypothetical protein
MTQAEMFDLPPGTPWWAALIIRWLDRFEERYLVPGWRQCWRWTSIQWPVFLAALCGVYEEYRQQVDTWILSQIPEKYRPIIAAAVILMGAFLRLKVQPPPKEK